MRRAHEVTGPSLFQEQTLNSTNLLNMLELSAVPPMSHLQPDVSLQQDDVPPAWGITITDSLNKLELSAVPPMSNLQPDVSLQQDDVPPAWGITITDSLNKTFPNGLCG
jgi:hypothetical protein